MNKSSSLADHLADYERTTLAAIRSHKTRLNKLSQEKLRLLYRRWSNETSSAGWLVHNDQSILNFIKWATTAPCDRRVQ